MAEQDKAKWWSSLPGMLTAATGFVAALSGLIAGLGQLGVFDRRETAAPQEVAATPAAPPRAEVEEHTAAGDSARADSPPAAVRAAPAPVPRSAAPRSPSGLAPGPAPAPVAPRVGTSAPAADTVTGRTERRAGVLRAGTVLELATTARACAPDSGTRRFTARTAAPVRTGGTTALPRGTGAVLRLGRGATANTVVIRLDSLLPPDTALPVPRSATRVRRGSVTGACIKPASRISVTLGAAVSVPGS
jgi:hypothetical protein